MIDLFTVAAQIINFLILVGLLRYFLYGRILAAMEKRQQEITSRWEEAQLQREQAEDELHAAQQKNRELDEQREKLLTQVRDEVEQYRQQLTTKVREDVEDLRTRWSDGIQEETEAFLRDLRRRASAEVCAIARRALDDLASANLERQIVEHFLHKVEQLKEAERKAIVSSLEEGDHVAVVQTTCQLSDDLQQCIERTLQERLLENLDVRFQQSEDLLCGIALQTNAHKLAWNLRDHLDALEQELQRALEEETASTKLRRKEMVGR